MGDLNPQVTLALTLIGLGITTTEKIIELWRREGVDDEILATIQTEADKRLEQWKAL